MEDITRDNGQAAPVPFDAPYAPLRIDPGLEIRTLTALRPYRPSGFVLRHDELAGKTLVHNYGHGGCGVTLSWGCAEQAADLVGGRAGDSVAVIGAGVVGLTTARVLQGRGYKVTVYAEDFPPNTTSDVAGAYWFPITLYEEGQVSRVFLAQFRAAAREAYRQFFSLVGNPRYGVSWMRFFELDEEVPEAPEEPRVEGEELYPGKQIVTDPARALGFPYAVRHHGFMIDPEVFLPALIEDIREEGGDLEQRRFETREDIAGLAERHIVNCTGLGAKALFDDDEMIPVKGQLSLIERPEGIDYGYALGRGETDYCYMFPRRSSLVIGGTKHVGREDLETDDNDRQRIFEGHREIVDRLRKSVGQHWED